MDRRSAEQCHISGYLLGKFPCNLERLMSGVVCRTSLPALREDGLWCNGSDCLVCLSFGGMHCKVTRRPCQILFPFGACLNAW